MLTSGLKVFHYVVETELQMPLQFRGNSYSHSIDRSNEHSHMEWRSASSSINLNVILSNLVHQ